MKTIKKLLFNWRQTGSTLDRNGAGEDYDQYTVGVHGVKSITEHRAAGEGDKWYYDVENEDGSSSRIFNPNFVEYFK